MKRTIIIAIAAALTAWGGYAISHSGGTDANGCHKDHKTGDFHCH